MTGIKNRAISILLAFVFILSAFAVPAAAAEPLNASELYLGDDGTELAEGIEYTGDERTDPAIEGDVYSHYESTGRHLYSPNHLVYIIRIAINSNK